MGWYTVIKTINKRKYLYLQMTHREGGKVKTKNKYLGPATGGFGSGAPRNLPTAPHSKIEKPAGGIKIDKIKRFKPSMTLKQLKRTKYFKRSMRRIRDDRRRADREAMGEEEYQRQKRERAYERLRRLSSKKG